jgi:hypothetical protein
MVTSKTYTHAVLFSRPAGRRRIEVFSPKLARRLSLGGYDAYRTWLVIEANPRIRAFCERPTYVDGPRGTVIDFWVQLSDDEAGEFWMIEPTARRPTAVDQTVPVPPSRLHGLNVRYITRADLLAWSIPIANWARITPYLVSHRLYQDRQLAQSIETFLDKPASIDAILKSFAQRDTTTVEAALFFLLATGRVLSPDLARAPLSGSTRFHQTEGAVVPAHALA